MCILFWVLAPPQRPDIQFMFTGNRDEFFHRPTEAAHWWPLPQSQADGSSDESLDDSMVLAGRDGEKQGTWHGLTRQGRFAAVTNFREPPLKNGDETQLLSRGRLVVDCLQRNGEADLSAGIEKVRYPGFNLISMDIWNPHRHYCYMSNRADDLNQLEVSKVYGMSNATLQTAETWPKVEIGRLRFQHILNDSLVASNADICEKLIAVLADQEQCPRELLPRTGMPEHIEQQLSPIFIDRISHQLPQKNTQQKVFYGTRSSTVIIVDKQGKMHYQERTFHRNEETGGISHQTDTLVTETLERN